MPQNALPANHSEISSPDAETRPFSWTRASCVFIGPALASLGLDRITKIAAERHLTFSVPEKVLGEYVRVVLWFNEGAAFGMTFGGKWAHVILSLIAMVVVTYLVWRTPREHSLMLSGFALILGGAAGNLWDRLLAGKVTDFIDVGIGSLRWPTFNVADASVVVGVFLILLTSWRTSRAEQTAKETTAHPAQTAATEGTPAP